MEPINQMVRIEVPNPLSLIELAIKTGVKADELTQLVGLEERVAKARAAEVFAEALACFQRDCPMITKTRAVMNKDRSSERYRFAGYEDIMAVARPILAQYKITHSFSTPKSEDGRYLIICHLQVGSHCVDRPFTAAMPDLKKLAESTYMNEAQAQGAWLSYMKRYAFCSATGVVVCDEDSDLVGEYPSISPKQMREINDIIAELPPDCFNFDKFLAFLGCDSLENLPVTEFGRAMYELKRKARQVKEAGGPS